MSETRLPFNPFPLINGLVLVVVCVFVVDAAMTWLAARLATEPVITIAPQVRMDSQDQSFRPFADYKVIVQRNLFGDAALMREKPKPPPPPPPPPPDPIKTLPKASPALNLELFGTVISNDPEQNKAVIHDRSSNEAGIYRKGDKIRNVEIRQIDRFYVVVNDGKQDMLLAMEIATLAENGGGTADQQPGQPQPPAAQRPQVPQALGYRNPPPNRVGIGRGDIQNSMSHIDKVMKDARFSPVTNDGKTSGYKLTNIKDDSIYSKMQLQEGDVVTGINGEPVSNPAGLMKLYQNLADQQSVSIEIERQGEKQTVTYDIY